MKKLHGTPATGQQFLRYGRVNKFCGTYYVSHVMCELCTQFHIWKSQTRARVQEHGDDKWNKLVVICVTHQPNIEETYEKEIISNPLENIFLLATTHYQIYFYNNNYIQWKSYQINQVVKCQIKVTHKYRSLVACSIMAVFKFLLEQEFTFSD